MTDPLQSLQALLNPESSGTLRYAPTSRYYGLQTSAITTPDGRTTPFLRRRLIPPPETLTLLREHTVAQGERLDQIAAAHFGDPEQYWRLCDAAAAMDPAELEEAGLRLRITLPQGFTGVSSA